MLQTNVSRKPSADSVPLSLLYLPDGFDPEKHLPARLQRFSDDARRFMHIVMLEHFHAHKQDCEYVPLMACHLRRQVNERAYIQIRDALLVSGALEWDNQYTIGHKSKAFRIGQAYRSVPLVEHPVTCLDAKKQAPYQPVLLDDTSKWLWAWLQRVELDFSSASEFLVGMKKKHRNASNWVSLLKFKNRELFFNADLRGRVYSNLTSLNSEFRQFLSLEGHKLVNLDIANSQPLFFGLLLKQQILSDNKSSDGGYLPLYIYDATASRDIEQYITLCAQGKLYDYLMETLGIKTRNQAKQRLFASIFYGKQSSHKKDMFLRFADLFPTVAQHIKKHKAGNYKALALEMQRCEADLMIQGVCKRLSQTHPTAPLLTIHDSIMTTENYASLIRSAMIDEFKRFGVQPQIRIDSY